MSEKAQLRETTAVYALCASISSLRTGGLWTLSIGRHSKPQRTERSGKWICFLPQVTQEGPTLLGPFESYTAIALP
jgi:hypothetical protein